MPVWVSISIFAAGMVCAADWPQFGGPNRDGTWNETGTLQTLPPEGLRIRWRAPVGWGLSSPVIAEGRVYLIDAKLNHPSARERIQCWDETTGLRLWTHDYGVSYPEWGFDPASKAGPGSTPVCETGKLFALGATDQLTCLDAALGTVLWERNLRTEYGLEEYAGNGPSLLIEGDLLILVIGGKPDACVIALDKNRGTEVWRALGDRSTYSSPIVIDAGGVRQLIVWTPEAVTSLDPATGKTWWREPRTLGSDFAVALPQAGEGLLLAGGLMFQLDSAKPAATVLWPENTIRARHTLSQTSGPLLRGGFVYSHKSQGALVCLDGRTGKILWEREAVVDAKAGACIHLIPNLDAIWLFTDQGDLIRTRLSPEGFEELGRAHLVDPTYPFGGRLVVWPPPAFANRHVFARNDEELICASLEASAGPPQ